MVLERELRLLEQPRGRLGSFPFVRKGEKDLLPFEFQDHKAKKTGEEPGSGATRRVPLAVVLEGGFASWNNPEEDWEVFPFLEKTKKTSFLLGFKIIKLRRQGRSPA